MHRTVSAPISLSSLTFPSSPPFHSSISSGQLNCTSASDMLGGGPVMVFIDDANVSNDEVVFNYRNNPSYESVSPMNTIPAYVS